MPLVLLMRLSSSLRLIKSKEVISLSSFHHCCLRPFVHTSVSRFDFVLHTYSQLWSSHKAKHCAQFILTSLFHSRESLYLPNTAAFLVYISASSRSNALPLSQHLSIIQYHVSIYQHELCQSSLSHHITHSWPKPASCKPEPLSSQCCRKSGDRKPTNRIEHSRECQFTFD